MRINKNIFYILLLPLILGFVNQADNHIGVKTFDTALLNDLVMQKINKKRVKKGLSAFVLDEHLSDLCLQYNSEFEGRNYKNTSSIERKIEKTLYTKAKKKGFKGGLILPIVADAHAMDFNDQNDFFSDKLQTTSEFKLFEGKKPAKSNKNYDYIEIKSLSYSVFADKILNELTSENKKQLYSKAFKWAGLHLQWHYKSLFKRKLPRVKMICIVGGYQTAGMR